MVYASLTVDALACSIHVTANVGIMDTQDFSFFTPSNELLPIGHIL